MYSTRKEKQQGAVSLFIVIFTTLLITVITVSFIRIMIVDHQQSSDSDLSQSAYDSALAGVEDAKRAVSEYYSSCVGGGSPKCTTARAALDSTVCNEGLAPIGIVEQDEVKIQADSNMNQAYTCVKIAMATTDYLGTLTRDTSKVIPIKGESSFDTVTLNWYTLDDIPQGTAAIDLSGSSTKPLFKQADWKQNRPSMMRTQFIQPSNTLDAIDADARTLFLYPSTTGAATLDLAAIDVRKQPSNDAPTPVRCKTTLAGGGYACTAVIRLAKAVPAGQELLTRITSLYNASHYQVLLSSGATSVKFDSVQPEVDSTGRANDLFKRVKARIERGDAAFPYPEAAIDVRDSFCKTFRVTDEEAGYEKGTCTP